MKKLLLIFALSLAAVSCSSPMVKHEPMKKQVHVPEEFKDRVPASSCDAETFCSVIGKYKNLCDQVNECMTEVSQPRCAWVDTRQGNGTDWCKFQVTEQGCNAVGPFQGCAWRPARAYCVPR